MIGNIIVVVKLLALALGGGEIAAVETGHLPEVINSAACAYHIRRAALDDLAQPAIHLGGHVRGQHTFVDDVQDEGFIVIPAGKLLGVNVFNNHKTTFLVNISAYNSIV